MPQRATRPGDPLVHVWSHNQLRQKIGAAGEIVDLASEAGLIEKSGAYYVLNGERIAEGRDKACQ